MTLPELIACAEKVVGRTQAQLPAPIRQEALRLPVVYHDWPSEEILADEFDPDILGMFAGSPHGEDTGDRNALPGHIMLFLENIWEFAEGDPATFRDEVRITYLHELGHYLGWDEDDVESRGLA